MGAGSRKRVIELETADYDRIWIAAMVPEKIRALDLLAELVQPGTKTIVRVLKGRAQIWSLPAEDVASHPAYEFQGSRVDGLCHSLLLVARPTPLNDSESLFGVLGTYLRIKNY